MNNKYKPLLVGFKVFVIILFVYGLQGILFDPIINTTHTDKTIARYQYHTVNHNERIDDNNNIQTDTEVTYFYEYTINDKSYPLIITEDEFPIQLKNLANGIPVEEEFVVCLNPNNHEDYIYGFNAKRTRLKYIIVVIITSIISLIYLSKLIIYKIK